MSSHANQTLPYTVLGTIFLLWFLSDIGFYLLLPVLGAESSYSNDPFILALYYLVWIGVTVCLFWKVYKKWEMITPTKLLFASCLVVASLITFYITLIFPRFDAIPWLPYLKPPAEFLSASPWYFFPKSIETIFQQLLVTAMVLALHAAKYSLKDTAQWSAVFFGGAHLVLVFGQSFSYMVVFTLFATIAGRIFPYLLLRVKNGFLYTFTLHWTFYAVILVVTRVLYVH